MSPGWSRRRHSFFTVVSRVPPIEPWQFDRVAYLRALADHPHTAPLTGSPVVASWDPGLGEAMRTAGRQIEEELVAAELLEQLSGSAGTHAGAPTHP
jgi:hypothetical protein